MLATVVAMDIYIIKYLNLGICKSWISGSFLVPIDGVCASCSSIGFLIVSPFAGVGIIDTIFLTNYPSQLRMSQ